LFAGNKIVHIDGSVIRNTLGAEFKSNFCYQPAQGTRGGIVLVVRDSVLQLQQPHLSKNSVTAIVLDHRSNAFWTVTGVYGPQGELEKRVFLRELREIKQSVRPHWLLIGDFNLIYKEQDKSNGRLNRHLMNRFRRTLNYMEVKELELMGKKFTWSNNQAEPTLARIDRAFCTPAWEDIYANPILQPLSSSISDHCPLLLMHLCPPATRPIFRFESFWTQIPDFQECVQEAWTREVSPNQTPQGYCVLS
jgi:exonuclease III